MGVVYEAKQTALSRSVALKMILGRYAANSDYRARFLVEAEAIAAVRHPNVVQIFDSGEHAGHLFLVMELLTGGTLAKQLEECKRLPARDAATLLEKIARAVHAAHAAGIVHRDLKPGNILFSGYGRQVSAVGLEPVSRQDESQHPEPKVTDFGLAKRETTDLTQTGQPLGTPAYMAPEQTTGAFVGPTTDVWALGVILYESLTGIRPFASRNMHELFEQIRTTTPAAPRKTAMDIPRDLERVCLKCLEKSATERYPTACTLADDLRRFLNGEPVAVRSAHLLERGYKWAKRKPMVAAAWGMLVVSIVLGVFSGISCWFWQEAVRERGTAEEERAKAEAARVEANRMKQVAEEAKEKTDRALISEREAKTSEAGIRLTLARIQELDARRLQSQVATSEGLRAAASGDRELALLWFAEAVARNPDDPVTTPITRQRFAGYRRYPVQMRPAYVVRNRPPEIPLEQPRNEHEGKELRILPEAVEIWDQVANIRLSVVWDSAKSNDLPYALVNRPISAEYSPDGTQIVATFKRGVAVWDAKSGELMQRFLERGEAANEGCSASYSPNGKYLLVVNNGLFQVWSALTWKSLGVATGTVLPIRFAAFSPNSKQVLTISEMDRLSVWDLETRKEIVRRGQFDHVALARFSPDGLRLLIVSTRRWLMFDLMSSRVVLDAEMAYTWVRSVEYFPDDRRILLSTGDFQYQIWDELALFDTPRRYGTDRSSFVSNRSLDGRRVVEGRGDGRLRLYDVAASTPITPPLTFPGGWNPPEAWLSNNGYQVLTPGPDGSNWIWDIAPESADVADIVAFARAVSGRKIVASGTVLPLDFEEQKALAHLRIAPSRERHPVSHGETTAWYMERASAAESTNNWFAAELHLGRLHRSNPMNDDWKRRWATARATSGLSPLEIAPLPRPK